MERTATQETSSPKMSRTPVGGENGERKAEYFTSAEKDDSQAGSASGISDIVCKSAPIGLGTSLGLLSRTGIIIVSNELLKFELSGIVWSNILACFCMGMFVKGSSILGTSKDSNVYLALTTGYCGTFSSFSSAALELFNAAAGRTTHHQSSAARNTTEQSVDSGTPNIILKNISDFVGSTFVHVGVSFIGYHMGDTTASLILQKRWPEFMQWIRHHSKCLKFASIFISIIVIISSLLETLFFLTFNFFIYVGFSLVFALPGTCLRYLLSKWLNFGKRKNQKRPFPLGTFIANPLGSLVLATTTLLTLGIKPNSTLSKTDAIITNELLCCVLSAIGHGFCGALTTMSTLIAELTTMTNRIYIYVYAVPCVLMTVGSFMIVWGTYSWCLICVRMEPIKGPVWDDPVPKEPYKLKNPPWMNIENVKQYPCKMTRKPSSDSTDGPPPEWTNRGRRNAIWELDLDPAPVDPTAFYDTQLQDFDPCYRVCLCTRRNGLQDTCPLTGCGGNPPCLTTPTPSCEPSGFAPPSRFKDVEYVLCPAQMKQDKRAYPRKQPSSAPVTRDISYDSRSSPRCAHTY